MKAAVFLMGIVVFFNCFCFSHKTNKITNSISLADSNQNYIKDKKQLENCFIENVEYFRKYHREDLKIYVNSPDSVKQKYDQYYKKYPGADWDPANFFEPYSIRFDLKKDEYVNSPIPTEKQLTVTADTIVYSKDSLFCVALLVLYLHYDAVKGLEQMRDEGREFSAKAVIGYRVNAGEPFNIYPLTNHSVIGFESYEAASIMIKDLYFNRLKGTTLGGIYRGMKFKQNVGDKDFFSKSPYFQKHKSGLYNFQMYRHLGKDYPYHYQQCVNKATH